MEKSAIRILEKLKEDLQDMYGPRFRGLYVFGSYARGTQRPDSDLDVAFILDDFKRSGLEIERTGDLVVDISLQWGITVSLLPIKESDFRARAGLLARSVAREGIAV